MGIEGAGAIGQGAEAAALGGGDGAGGAQGIIPALGLGETIEGALRMGVGEDDAAEAEEAVDVQAVKVAGGVVVDAEQTRFAEGEEVASVEGLLVFGGVDEAAGAEGAVGKTGETRETGERGGAEGEGAGEDDQG